jgi:integrase
MTRSRNRMAGTVRQLPSGRWQARYYGPDGRRQEAHPSGGRSGTFERKTHAVAELNRQLAAIDVGSWRDPDAPSDVLADYAADWLALRNLKPCTAEHYRRLLDQLILPTFGRRHLGDITVPMVKTWYADLGRATGPTRRAHAYALLRSVLKAAVDDRIIDHNPCTIRAGGSARTVKKVKIATPAEVDTIAANMPDRYAPMILLGAWAALRFGELAALRRRNIDLDRAVVHVERAVVVTKGRHEPDDPKSKAGTREVAFHAGLVKPLREHLEKYCPDLDSLVFPGVLGGYLRPATFYDGFYPAREAAGRPDLKFHDLRHTGITAYAALPGVTPAELMRWSGHTTLAVSHRYQHPDPEDARTLVQSMNVGRENVVPMRRRASK